MTKIVIGLGYGDEGKGSVVNNFSSNKSVVIRFNGGNQSGHTVIEGNKRHVISHLGSGTLKGATTFWSQYCLTEPGAFAAEYNFLKKYRPKVIIHPLSKVITPYDIEANRLDKKNLKHGTCGLGIGTTVKRNLNGCTFYVKDLTNIWIRQQKLNGVKDYYNAGTSGKEPLFHKYSDILCEVVNISTSLYFHNDVIFEGSQGILLDEKHGFYPHTTYSSTTSKNALALIEEHGLEEPTVYYVTRSYLTRHGNGPMSEFETPVHLRNNREETNVYNKYQNHFRTRVLNTDLLFHALNSDAQSFNRKIVMTCMDQHIGKMPVYHESELIKIQHTKQIEEILEESMLFSYSPKFKEHELKGKIMVS